MVDPNIGVRSIADPLALRALAHPLRVELHRLVAREGTLTAAEAGRQLGISHALASHHLRQLAKYGYVEQAEASDARARPWRVTSTSMEFEPAEVEGRNASDALARIAIDHAARDLAAWQREADKDPAWEARARVRSGILYLTPDQLADLIDAWNAIVQPLVDQAPIGHHARRADATTPVSFTLVTVPLEPTERGG